jgi:transcriptional regulator with XRE-family HTH domain
VTQDHLTEREMAQLIAAHLVKIGKTQAELCREVGVSQKHMSQVLSGAVAARPAALDYWAWVLGMRFAVRLVRA